MARLHATVQLCCAKFIHAYDLSSRAVVSYIDDNGKARLYVTDWRNMLFGPIEFCPFCGKPVEISAHEQLIVGIDD